MLFVGGCLPLSRRIGGLYLDRYVGEGYLTGVIEPDTVVPHHHSETVHTPPVPILYSLPQISLLLPQLRRGEKGGEGYL